METVVIVAGVKEPIFITSADYIGVDYGVQLCLDHGIKPVIGIGDFDSINANFKIPLLVYPQEKDETDLELAIDYAINNYQNIIVSNCLGGRIDHELYNLKLLIKYPNITLVSPKQKVFILKQGKHIISNTHHYFSFFAIKDSLITLKNFKYPLEKELIKTTDFKTISNEILYNSGEIVVHSGTILCIQTND